MKKSLKTGVVWSLVASAVITAFTWLVLGENSPLNHGSPPDVHKTPLILPFVIFNLPAGIVYVNLFGKGGSEWGYFNSIFIQWFLVGAFVLVIKAYFTGKKPN